MWMWVKAAVTQEREMCDFFYKLWSNPCFVLWSTVVQCKKLVAPSSGSMKCSDPLGPSSYLSTCAFTCEDGYELDGPSSDILHCESSGNWNASQPSCVGASTAVWTHFRISMRRFSSFKDLWLMTSSLLCSCPVSCSPGFREWLRCVWWRNRNEVQL